MISGPNCERMRPKDGIGSATRWSTNHNWCFRGDNTKYKEKK